VSFFTICRPPVFVDDAPPRKTKTTASYKPDSGLDDDILDEVEDVDQSTVTDSDEPLALDGLSGKDRNVRNCVLKSWSINFLI